MKIQFDEAQIIASLLLEYSEPTLPLRSQIERFLEAAIAPWRLEIDQLYSPSNALQTIQTLPRVAFSRTLNQYCSALWVNQAIAKLTKQPKLE